LAVVAAVCLAAVPAALPMGAFAATGVATFSATGTNQAFTVPAGVSGIVAELFGARGGAGFVAPFTVPVSSQPGADGGHATATLAVTPGQNLEVAVGGHGIDGAAGGFNGGGDGSVGPGGCCSGGGGGGATDVRAGACATTLTCGLVDRVLVAGGGGGAGGGSNATTTGGAGGGTAGAAGADSIAPVASGGGGGAGPSGGGGGALLSLLVLPLYIPTLIFGAGAVQAQVSGQGASGHLSLLAALLVLSLFFAPWATTAALRIALE